MSVQFRILGPIEALIEGEQAALGAPKQRGLLALLLVNRRRVLTAEQLIDGLWGEDPPASALDHRRQNRPTAQIRAEHVDLEHVPPVRRVFGLFFGANTRDPAEVLKLLGNSLGGSEGYGFRSRFH